MGHGVRAQQKQNFSELPGQAQSSLSPHSIPAFLRTAQCTMHQPEGRPVCSVCGVCRWPLWRRHGPCRSTVGLHPMLVIQAPLSLWKVPSRRRFQSIIIPRHLGLLGSLLLTTTHKNLAWIICHPSFVRCSASGFRSFQGPVERWTGRVGPWAYLPVSHPQNRGPMNVARHAFGKQNQKSNHATSPQAWRPDAQCEEWRCCDTGCSQTPYVL
ncbi:uncharacterized protein B0T15DRAFT_44469 [Chaetomium strumarium]|uniref:Uncharacterized protein n=1 Tax=Chaetomium strumarium TaxID=1170767 RepID=A0AAJ0M6G6_9PEZI|nr:hypothetical protein B0T15DRAFT_44469 [Chaetomium strumarium]